MSAKDVKVTELISTAPVKRKDGTLAKVISVWATGNRFKGWTVESAKIDDAGNLQIVVIKENN